MPFPPKRISSSSKCAHRYLVALTQLTPQYLARGVAWQFIHEHNPRRYLEPGDLSVAVADYVAFGQLGTFGDDDKRYADLSPTLIRRPDHRSICNPL